MSAAAPPYVQRDFPLARLATVRTGGPAELFARVGGEAQLLEVLAWARRAGVPVAVVGSGSNLLVADEGVHGLVVKLEGELASIERVGERGLECGGGARLPAVAAYAARAGLAGIEFGVSIPGTVGGAVRMNANAYGGELARTLQWVEVVAARDTGGGGREGGGVEGDAGDAAGEGGGVEGDAGDAAGEGGGVEGDAGDAAGEGGGVEGDAGDAAGEGGGVEGDAGDAAGEGGGVEGDAGDAAGEGGGVRLERRAPGDLGFAYRSSALRASEIVARVAFTLTPAAPAEVKAALAALRARRHEAQPQGIRTFGSTFKNPAGGAGAQGRTAGQLLAEAGCAGLTVGGVRFAPKHANFIENTGAATTAEIVALMAEGRRRVLERTGVALEPEVQTLGPVRFPWG